MLPTAKQTTVENTATFQCLKFRTLPKKNRDKNYYVNTMEKIFTTNLTVEERVIILSKS